MKRIIKFISCIAVCLLTGHYTLYASSHREAPLISNDPLADNTDLYVFRSPCDTNNVVLIANYIPFEHPAGGPNYYNFGKGIRYEIHIDNNTATQGDDIVYRFTFTQTSEDPTTFFNIRLGKQNLKDKYKCEKSIDGGQTFATIVTSGIVPPNNIGPRSINNTTVGLGKTYNALINAAIMKASTGEKIFCGPVDDPFFVDLGGAFDIGNFRPQGRDGLAKFNCHSIVIEVPVKLLQKNGKQPKAAKNILDPDFVIGVYASASRQKITTFDPGTGTVSYSGKWVQVSRLGMPLTNEVIIPIGYKDKWNASDEADDIQFAGYLKNPELALYMDDSQFGSAVPGLSALRIQTKSLGSFDFRNGKPGLFPLKGTAAVAGTALDDAIFGNLLLPDNHSPRAVDLLPIFYTGVPNLSPYQLATGKPDGNPLAAGKPFINNFLPTIEDRLRLNMAVPVTPRNSPDFSSLGIIQAAALGLTDSRFNTSTALQFIPNMDGFPNGRRLEDDITTIELQAVSGVALAAIGLWYDDYTVGSTPSPLTPDFLSVYTFNAGVTQNDTTLKACFPYEQGPWRGFNGNLYKGPKSIAADTYASFIAAAENQTSIMKWHVADQSVMNHFEIEKSIDAKNYSKIGEVIASGNVSDYRYTDANPSLGKTNFYRIKQVDKNGNAIYSAVRFVKFNVNVLTVTPNPATSYITIHSTVENLQISIYDGTGKKYISRKLNGKSITIPVGSLIGGVYTVTADDNGVPVDSKKILKQ
ncbi:MAG TPA: DUF4331 family protein [Parafilimonas sp.]|nr:DUF4331 family protein [Parafilimonas sp.]